MKSRKRFKKTGEKITLIKDNTALVKYFVYGTKCKNSNTKGKNKKALQI